MFLSRDFSPCFPVISTRDFSDRCSGSRWFAWWCQARECTRGCSPGRRGILLWLSWPQSPTQTPSPPQISSTQLFAKTRQPPPYFHRFGFGRGYIFLWAARAISRVTSSLSHPYSYPAHPRSFSLFLERIGWGFWTAPAYLIAPSGRPCLAESGRALAVVWACYPYQWHPKSWLGSWYRHGCGIGRRFWCSWSWRCCHQHSDCWRCHFHYAASTHHYHSKTAAVGS